MDNSIAIRCCSCGHIVRRPDSEFCSEQCEQQGFRYCACGCGVMLRPNKSDTCVAFIRRNFAAKCRNRRGMGTIRCLSCGEFCSDEFCSDKCRQRGYRYCGCGCGAILRPQMGDKLRQFRRRKYYDAQCIVRVQAAHQKAKWQDPVVRARLIRGVMISHNTDEFVQTMRKNMLAKWKNPKFLAAQKKRRVLTSDQVREIRADPRSSPKICTEYGVSTATIVKIRSRLAYADV